MEFEKLDKFISKSSDNNNNIENVIYINYIKPAMILTELKKILNSTDSQKLKCDTLYYYLKNVVLSNSIVVKNLIDNDRIFKDIYDKHITKGNKNYIKIEDPIKSMALTWLMYLYH